MALFCITVLYMTLLSQIIIRVMKFVSYSSVNITYVLLTYLLYLLTYLLTYLITKSDMDDKVRDIFVIKLFLY